jgi:hypothetical protein
VDATGGNSSRTDSAKEFGSVYTVKNSGDAGFLLDK